MPVGDVDHTTLGLVQLFNHGKFLDFRQYPDAKEIFDFINANGGYDLDNKLISEEAIWASGNIAEYRRSHLGRVERWEKGNS